MNNPPIHVENLGLLQWDTSLDRWSTDIDVGLERFVELHIDSADGGVSPALLDYAKGLAAQFRRCERHYRMAAAKQFLDCYNDVWNDGPALSTESFADSLELDSIAINGDQIAEVAYLPIDNEMFGGHFMLCTIRDNDTVSDVHLVG